HTPFYTNGYDALVFRPEGGVWYFHSTTNTTPVLTQAMSQVVLEPLSGTSRPAVPGGATADANGIFWGDAGKGFRLIYPDGSQDVFGLCFFTFGQPQPSQPAANTSAHALLTQKIDPQGRRTLMGYEDVHFTNYWNYNDSYFAMRVRYVVDPD